MPLDPAIKINLSTPKVEDVQIITKDPNVIKLYGNGFQSQLTLSDANIVIKHNNVNVALVSMSLTSIKSLSDQLVDIISRYESNFDQKIPTINELAELAREKANKK